MPVWHVSLSVWSKDGARKLDLPQLAEQEGVRLLAGVGGQVEWWWWNPVVRVGHLRVALTVAENAEVAPGCVVADAGESGPQRPRTTVGR